MAEGRESNKYDAKTLGVCSSRRGFEECGNVWEDESVSGDRTGEIVEEYLTSPSGHKSPIWSQLIFLDLFHPPVP